MPDDLLRYLEGPSTYSGWWPVIGVVLLAAVIVWCAGVVVWTLPARPLRSIPLVGSLGDRLLRRRFARSIRTVRDRYRADELSAAQAAADMKHTLRSFLAAETGRSVHHMHVADMTGSELAPVEPMFSALNDAQFNTASDVDVDGIGRQAEELIFSWS